ncbi:DUF4391 domain-containing protein [Candidatus Sulfurimonas marisnigri]|uniref:DUF4391 domain-containing protein n=1 Tax=Candidatus Sulfurimonas marisnigri TaxID=2740405 RepID=A0A7S7RPV3_9BACT|nr:DUF4391 domain-containing protein [Candidatus Sulfurimonas marisnigri]QOY54011.1 DUF4391 domain-containing protein [Candidatus Sulfurimonas marisnigri]
MRQDLLQNLNIPSACKIGRKLFKKQFSENFTLNVNEKKTLTNDIESITLEYLLNKDNINIAPFVDDEKDYSEIAFIQVDILNKQKLKPLAAIIQNIPYPLIVLFRHENLICFNVTPKRINKNDSTKLVLEESLFTEWIDLQNASRLEEEFIKSLEIQNHPFTDFHSFYNSYLDKIIAFNASKHSGTLSITDASREILQEIQNIEAQISEVTSKIKKETNTRDKVNMNIELKKLNINLDELKGKL